MKKNQNTLILTILPAVLFLLSCHAGSKLSLAENKKLSQEIISDWIEKSASRDRLKNVYVDSMVVYRNIIFDRYWFDDGDSTYRDIAMPEWKHISFPLVIPEASKGNTRFIQPTTPVEYGDDLCYYFSPLLPTKDRGIYLLQVYFISSLIDDNLRLRVASRDFYQYKIEKNKAIRLGLLPTEYPEVTTLPVHPEKKQ